jgi:hypothetical protein
VLGDSWFLKLLSPPGLQIFLKMEDPLILSLKNIIKNQNTSILGLAQILLTNN